MKNSYNWGIIGPGAIAEKFANDLQYLPEAKLYAVASRNIGRAQGFAKKYDAKKAYGSYRELAEDPNVDIVYIATPHTSHFENSALCLKNKKAVLCEKPVTINKAQLEVLIQLAKNHNVFFMEALWTRFLPSFLKCEELIRNNAIGDVLLIEADFGFRAKYDKNSRLFNPELGGGSLLDVGIYPVFLSYILAGNPSDIKAFSTLSEDNVDYSTTILFEHENNIKSVLLSSVVAKTRIEAIIHGTAGTVKLNSQWFMSTSVELIKNGKSQLFEFPVQGMGYQYEAQEVMECLDKGHSESDRYSLKDSLSVISILDTIRSVTGIQYPAHLEGVKY